MKEFTDLGRVIEARWREANYDERLFPAIASAALREASIPGRINAHDVLAWLVSTPELPDQDDIDSKFGEPPITIYRGRRFFIQVLFWLTSSTSIHRHAFSGAFQVLEGSSLHSRYTFRVRRRVSSQMSIGDVRLRGAELLERGQIVEITDDLAHGLFHLESPSATIVVRTYVEHTPEPQYNYQPPFIAEDPFFKEKVQTSWIQGLASLLKISEEKYLELASDLLSRADLHTTFLVLQQAYRGLGTERAAPLLAAAKRRHGEVVAEIAATAREDLRRRHIYKLRRTVLDPEHRFFLALVLNLPNRDAMFELIQRRFPQDEPRARVLAWSKALSGVDSIGIDLDDDLNSHLFEALLDGCTNPQIFERLGAEYEIDDIEAQRASIERHISRIKSTVLEPLFRIGIEAGSAAAG